MQFESIQREVEAVKGNVIDVKSCLSVKKMILTSVLHAEHPLAGRNTQQTPPPITGIIGIQGLAFMYFSLKGSFFSPNYINLPFSLSASFYP